MNEANAPPSRCDQASGGVKSRPHIGKSPDRSDVFIYVAQRILYSEVEFCVVEFAIQLALWLGYLGPESPDFVYTSMESDIEGLVRIVRLGPDQWHVAAVHQAYEEARTFRTYFGRV